MSETPSAVMYADLRAFAGLSNRDVARAILSGSPASGGKIPRLRVDDKTFLSRSVVHVTPNEVRRDLFGDFSETTPALAARIIKDQGTERTLEHFCNSACNAMCEALGNYNVSQQAYRNVVSQVMLSKASADDKALLLIILFVSCGSLADPMVAGEIVRTYGSRRLGVSFDTQSSEAPKEAPEAPKPTGLGLLRIVDGIAKPPIYPIDEGSTGTVIGYLPDAPHVIADVEMDVSQSHLRIFKQDDAWYAQDLGSRNGTVLISGADKSIFVLGEPQQKPQAMEGAPAQIENGDRLRLGSNTVFLVMSIAS